jgi:hypothetical protein
MITKGIRLLTICLGVVFLLALTLYGLLSGPAPYGRFLAPVALQLEPDRLIREAIVSDRIVSLLEIGDITCRANARLKLPNNWTCKVIQLSPLPLSFQPGFLSPHEDDSEAWYQVKI